MEMVVGNAHVIEVQARKRADSDPTVGTIGLTIRFLKNGHADHGKYWDGAAWQAAVQVVATTPLSFHAHQYAFAAGTLAADMRGGWITARVADASAIHVGDEARYSIVLYTLDNLIGQLGEHAITVHVQDENTFDLPNANVSIYTSDNSTFITAGVTDAGGDKIFALAAGTYKVRLSLNLYGFTVPETMVVSTDDTKTFTGTSFTAPTPANPDNCSIYGTLRDAGGNLLVGETVKIYAATPQGLAAVMLGERGLQATTDASGEFTIEVQKLAVVWVHNPVTGVQKKLTVPNAASQDISTWTTWVPA
jgi:hypothetical protein